MTTTLDAPVQNLPTPSPEFWEALKVVRNYLLHNRAEELFAHPAVQYRGLFDLKEALSTVEYYLYLVQSEEEDSRAVE
ncbi:MAG: hypothetical protein R3C18_02840 [Planctomycetaceae bacterium]